MAVLTIFALTVTWKLLVVIICFCIWFKSFLKNRYLESWIKQFPSPKLRLPLLGNTHLCWGHVTKVADMFESQTNLLGPIWIFWKFNRPEVIISDHETAKQILLSSTNMDKHADYETTIEYVLGKNSLISSPGSQWSHDRKYLQRAFHFEFFKELAQVASQEGISLVCKIKDYMNNGKSSFEVEGVFSECMAKISTRSQCNRTSVRLAPHEYKDILRIVDLGRRMSYFYVYLGFLKRSFLWRLCGIAKLEKDLVSASSGAVQNIANTNVVENVGETHEDSKLSLWSLLFDPAKSFNWSKDHVVTFVSAATDTAAISTTMTLFYLANHPECLKKAIEEVDGIFPESVSEITGTDLSKLKYVEMCWKEALRLHSPVPLIGRKLSEKIQISDGRYIPAGTNVYIHMTQIHRNGNLFYKPNEFIPERFDEVNVKSIAPGSYMPFSYGPRNCIGSKSAYIQAKTVLAQVLWHFSISTQQRLDEIKPAYQVTSYPFPALRLDFKSRRNC